MAHILVVDDRPANIEVVATMLGYCGHRVERASDGEEAWEMIGRQVPDLLITDLVMPNLGGEDLIRRLRTQAATAALPVIIHTASYRSRNARQIADGLGVRWILPKPCEPQDLLAMVSDALGEPMSPVADPEPANDPPPSGFGELASASAEPGLAQRLDGIVNLGLGLASERDPQGLVELFSESARRILRARYVGVVALASDGRLRAFASRGLPAAAREALAVQATSCEAAQALIRESAGTGMLLAAKPGDFTGLPAAHPPVRSFMACPVLAQDQPVGWMYVADRQGDLPFPVEDERVLLALAAVLGSFHGSLLAMDRLDRRVAERTRELEAANTELEAFSFLVSHDLRAPLANIAGLVKLVQHAQGANLPAAARGLERIEANVAAMTALIESLLHFARMSRQPVRLQRVALADVVRACIEAHAEEIARRGIDVRVQDLPVCQADPALLAQVFANLIGNAVKYTRRAQRPEIEVGGRRVALEHLLYVRDNGAGFDMAAAQGMFAPFQRFHAASEFEGSGVGLAVVKQIVTRHGGRVWAESRPEQGACFTFTLPSS